MKMRFGPLTAVLIACLCVPEARAGGSVKEPFEYRQLMYLQSVDANGAEWADRFSAMFVYLHRQTGVSFSTSPLVAIRENPRAQMALMKGIATDAKVRDSFKEWLKLSARAVTADFDSLGGTEAKILSRDRFSSALLSSPKFWQRIIDISRTENFDFRPVIHREMRAIQFGGNAAAWIVGGGAFGAAFRFLKLGRVALIAASVPAVAITGVQLWDLAHVEDERAPTKEEMHAKVTGDEVQTEIDIKVLHEHQRRLLILTKTRDLQTALSQGTAQDLLEKYPDLVRDIIQLKPMLEMYRAKMRADQLPIKAKVDDSSIRTETANAVDFLINFADELEP